MAINTRTIELKTKLTKEENGYMLLLTIKNVGDDILSFNFSNSSGSFIRRCMQVYNEKQEIYNKAGGEFINPINYEVEEIHLNKEEAHTIPFKGNIREYDYGKLLEFHGKSIFIEQGKTYYLQIEYKGAVSNMVAFSID